MADNPANEWDTFKLNLSRIPWIDFLVSLFAPLTIMEIASMLGMPLTGVYVALGWLGLIMIIMYVTRRTISMFAIITLIMTATRTIAAFLSPQHPFFALIPSLDNTVLGLIFIGSMLRPRPLVMALIGKDTIERTEAKFGKSKFFFKAWFDINIIWGMFYVLQGIFISYTMILNVNTGKLLDFLLGWPVVLVMLYISVDYPGRYWARNWEKMKVEIEAAQQYESRSK